MSSEIRDQYDWIVIGDHPGALLSACLAARLNLSTLVLPLQFSRVRHEARDAKGGSPVLDFEPNFLIGLTEGTGLLDACLARLEARPAQSRECLSQVATPGARVKFFRERSAMEQELVRELGSGADTWGKAVEESLPAILEYWKSLPERLTIQKKDPEKGPARPGSNPPRPLRESAAPALKGIGTTAGAWYSVHQRLSDLEERQRLLFQGLWSQIASGSSAAGRDEDPTLRDFFTLACLSKTAARFPGGMTAYRAFLLKTAENFGAHVLRGEDCSRVFFRGGQFSGIQVGSQGQMTAGTGGAVGCSLARIRDRVRGGTATAGGVLRSRLKAPLEPSGWQFTLSLELRPGAIPPGFSSPLSWKEEGAPALCLELPEEAGQTLLLRTLLPFSEESLDGTYQRMVAARMVRQAGELLPFLETNLMRVFPDFREEAIWDQAAIYGYASLSEIPENFRVYSGGGIGAQSGIEGLFSVSDETYPQLGSLGPTVAAVEAVAWIAHRSGLSGPFE